MGFGEFLVVIIGIHKVEGVTFRIFAADENVVAHFGTRIASDITVGTDVTICFIVESSRRRDMTDEPQPLSNELLDEAVGLLGRNGQRGTLRVQGRSMLPLLREGQEMRVDFERGPWRRGDLLLFRMGRFLVVHRLLSDGSPDAGTLIADAWNHLLFVYTPVAEEAVYYINGEHAATVTSIDSDVLPNLTAFGIGARNPSDITNIFEQGLIDDVRIYNFGLSSLNAASLYTEFITDSICLDGELPQFDLTGDCVFDIEDFAQIAATWLDCNLVPDCIAPQIP